ncbi:MAG TPA: hypothetical protein VGJ75_04630 [Dongiaceae bacterium]|jgi:uncharacterized membrane protein
MFLIVTVIVLAIIVVRFLLRLAGVKLRPWLPETGRWRYRIDAAIAGLILLCFAIGIGMRPSFPMALAIAVLAVLIAGGLQAARKAKAQPRP